jgi:hypothetical protein
LVKILEVPIHLHELHVRRDKVVEQSLEELILHHFIDTILVGEKIRQQV